MEAGLEAGTLKAGVTSDSVTAGEADEEGVEACSVANRSGVGEAAIGRLHPTRKKKRQNVKKLLSLLIQFD